MTVSGRVWSFTRLEGQQRSVQQACFVLVHLDSGPWLVLGRYGIDCTGNPEIGMHVESDEQPEPGIHAGASRIAVWRSVSR